MSSCWSQRWRGSAFLLAFAAISSPSTDGWSVKPLLRYRLVAPSAPSAPRTRIRSFKDSFGHRNKEVEEDSARKDNVSNGRQPQSSSNNNKRLPFPPPSETTLKRDVNADRPIQNNGSTDGRMIPKTSVSVGKTKTRFKAKRLNKAPASSRTSAHASASASAPAPSYSSLLPPIRPSDLYSGEKQPRDDEHSLINGLSSWDDFLGVPAKDRSSPHPKDELASPPGAPQNIPDRLHSIQDLFPATASGSGAANVTKTRLRQQSQRQPKQFSLDGVLPVSDLFYRSSTAAASEDSQTYGQPNNSPTDGVLPVSDLFYQARNDTDRNIAANETPARDGPSKTLGAKTKARGASGKQQSPSSSSFDQQSPAKKQRDRKMVRRGMEMLVGGVSINADPPQRSLELSYRPESDDWASVITLNTNDFGPLLHAESVKRFSVMEKAIFCEYWVHSALKWKVCPKDLQEIVEAHTHSLLQAEAESTSSIDATDSPDVKEVLVTGAEWASDELKQSVRDSHEVKIGTWFPDEMDLDSFFENVEKHFIEDTTRRRAVMDTGRDTPKGFGKPSFQTRPAPKKNHKKELFEARFGLSQTIPVAQEDLESGAHQNGRSPIQNVFLNAFLMMIGEMDGFDATISKFELVDQDDGVTSIVAEFSVSNHLPMTGADIQRRLKRMGAAFEAATDSGYFQILVARAAKREPGWSEQVRNQVVNECLLADDDLNDSDSDYDSEEISISSRNPAESAADTRSQPSRDGTDEKIPDYSLNNAANAPYKGELGLALYTAVTERAKVQRPRVIAIGDVHGCVDELQDLLRECDYRPGDLVVMLGDLVCKGPGSLAVVEMSREIGAVSICGNHDYEVRRWQKAIESGVEHPFVGTEHYHIATRLSKADMKWVDSLPWFISSKELGALFVHAGFVSGIRLAKQNPRLMTNMRSILPDGTVTSKFFNNWPWARLWDGPQTVLFGHDADRGLQQYEHAIGLDTGCVYGGRLTACILPEKRLVSVSARREYFKYRRKHYD